MTDTPLDLSRHTTRTFLREEHGTQVSETKWTFTGMRSLRASWRNGIHHIAFITHDDTDSRQATLGAHDIVEIEVGCDDSLALDITVLSKDGTPLTLNLFGVTLDDLVEAVAQAVAEKQHKLEDSNP
jgi:hypothetical protein